MNIFQNISIRTRFNFITIFVIILISFIILFFTYSINKVNRYNEYNENINNLKIHYLNIRRYEQHFISRYHEDANFFISGENTYIQKLNSEAVAASKIITELKKSTISNKLKLIENINKLEAILQNYILSFNNLTQKIYKRGSLNGGILYELKISAEKLDNLYGVPGSAISKMTNYSEKYMYSFDEKYFELFLKEYGKLSNLSNPETLTVPENSITADKHINEFKNIFTALAGINKEIGVSYNDGIKGQLRNMEFSALDIIVNIVNENKYTTERISKRNIFIFFGLITLIFLYLFWRFSNSIVEPLTKLKEYIYPLSKGSLPKVIYKSEGKNEISDISENLNSLVQGLKQTTEFALSIGRGKYSIDYTPLSKEDSLGNALLEMRSNLIIARDEEQKRKEEDEIRSWTNVGLTKFNDILRQNQGNINEMSIAVISELVKFINANQGGMFVFNDDEENKYLELTAAYAYGHEKKKQKHIYLGEGLVGTVAVEKETIYMTDIPESYITISSGLGGSSPRSLLIVPMTVEDEVIGVVELASFNLLKTYEIEFVENLSKNIASSLSITRINQRTAFLFEQSQRQAELMKVQEEEMRQNFEELQQVQEESSRNAAEMSSILDAIDSSSSIFNIDSNGIIESVNQQFLMLTNIPEDKLVGEYHKNIFHFTEDEYKEFWNMLLAGENIQKIEYLKIDENEIWLSVVYRPIMDNNGKIRYIFSVGINLTESKELENQLKEKLILLEEAQKEAERKQHILENTNEMLIANERTLQSAIENAMKQRKELAKKMEEIAEEEAITGSRLEGINQTNISFNFDLEGNIFSSNKIFNTLFGFNENDVIGTNISSILTENFLNTKAYEDLWEKLKNGKHHNGTFNFKSSDNKKIFIQGTFTAIKDRRGKTTSVFFIGFDLSDLARKTEELTARETELFFQIEDMQKMQNLMVKQEAELIAGSKELAEKEAVSKSRLEGINQTNIIAEFSIDGIITDVNENFINTFGYQKDEILSKNQEILFSEKVIETKRYKQLLEDIQNGKHVSGTFNFIGKNKNKIFIQGTFTIIKDSSNNINKIILMGFDTTDLVMRTEELKARETEMFFKLQELEILQEKLKNKK